jgi:hypothetical protein
MTGHSIHDALLFMVIPDLIRNPETLDSRFRGNDGCNERIENTTKKAAEFVFRGLLGVFILLLL